jgi:hypothetical protein
MSRATEHTARKARECGTCTGWIKPGERYVRHVVFPGDEFYEEGTRPWVIAQCADCATRRAAR